MNNNIERFIALLLIMVIFTIGYIFVSQMIIYKSGYLANTETEITE